MGPSVSRRALEADRYNHITATYFLLAERMLREKQEKQGHRLSLVYNLAKEVQSRSAPSPALPRPPRVPSAGSRLVPCPRPRRSPCNA